VQVLSEQLHGDGRLANWRAIAITWALAAIWTVASAPSNLQGGLESSFALHKLEDILANRGYSTAEIDGVCFNNWLQFFLKNLPK